MLADADPAVRGLAAEALATLDEPDDAPRIAKLLDKRFEPLGTESGGAMGAINTGGTPLAR